MRRGERLILESERRPCAVVKIRNRKGLHARASAKFVKCAENFNATVRVTREDRTVGGTSIMSLMALAAGPGAEIFLEAEGPEAPEAIEALGALVEPGFGVDN
jgi:phosphocarrier protein